MNCRLLLLCGLFLLQTLAYAAKPPAVAAPDPKTQRMFGIKIRQASTAFEERDYAAARKYVDDAEKLIPDSPATMNLRGALLYREKKYDEALAEFQNLIARDANSYPGYFNTAEVHLAQKKYDLALAGFLRILDARPMDEMAKFRVVLVLALQGKTAEALERADKMPNPGQTAAYYFAHAAIEFVNKNPAKGQQWIKQSEAFFPAKDSESLRMVLEENGLIKE